MIDAKNTLKRLRNKYRLVIMNDDTYEEVVRFRLNRLSVYIVFSTIFVVLVGFTVALIVFTPLKMYVPGYGNTTNKRELQNIKMRTDSLEQALKNKDIYLQSLREVLSGNTKISLDTNLLTIPKTEVSTE